MGPVLPRAGSGRDGCRPRAAGLERWRVCASALGMGSMNPGLRSTARFRGERHPVESGNPLKNGPFDEPWEWAYNGSAVKRDCRPRLSGRFRVGRLACRLARRIGCIPRMKSASWKSWRYSMDILRRIFPNLGSDQLAFLSCRAQRCGLQARRRNERQRTGAPAGPESAASAPLTARHRRASEPDVRLDSPSSWGRPHGRRVAVDCQAERRPYQAGLSQDMTVSDTCDCC